MSGRVVFLLEEPSMKAFLSAFLPRLIPGWRAGEHEELEAWYLAQPHALADAYSSREKAIIRLANRHADPDALAKPSREWPCVLAEFQKQDAARRLGQRLDSHDTRSASFRVFVTAVRQLAAAAGGVFP
ncbi:MAG: hypothetical protein H5U09_07175 [Desulfomicrobiaceae bacterium]|nr:hypothetical protein [Desulfomicrobiaceae bacterium]